MFRARPLAVITESPHAHMLACRYKVQTMVDGSKFEFFANGIRVDTMANGEVVETHPDGTVLRRKIESNVCVSCSQCQTIINASKGHLIVCCPICRLIMLANQVGGCQCCVCCCCCRWCCCSCYGGGGGGGVWCR
jgi:hypothetical protein